MSHNLKVCEKGSKGGIWLPAFGEDEQGWPKEVRACAYSVALLYFFLGISVVSDQFMEAIEIITSQKMRVKSKIHHGKWVTVFRWNATVANLTLMALGSSAPEILLSLVELIGADMHSGELGPSTVLGSAAFNLFVIVAVCVSAIPDGKVRYIQARWVFVVTAIYSLIAYIWLLLIVEYISPGRIEVWEGLFTLAMMPIFVFNSFIVDKIEYAALEAQNMQRHEQEEKERLNQAIGVMGSQLSMKTDPITESTGSASYQNLEEDVRPLRSTRATTGFRLMMGGLTKDAKSIHSLHHSGSLVLEKDSKGKKYPRSEPDVVLQFEPEVVLGGHGKDSVCTLTVIRQGNTHGYTDVKYETYDGVCKQGVDYTAKSGSLVFAPGETSKEVEIQLLPACGTSGYFKVKMTEAETSVVENKVLNVGLGENKFAYIVIAKDPSSRISRRFGAGLLTFGTDLLEVPMGRQEKRISVPVFRLHAVDTVASCCFRTESLSAVPGYDYMDEYGNLNFMKGQGVAFLELVLLPKRLGELEDQFQIVLDSASGAVHFDTYDDGGQDKNILTVTILNSRNGKGYGMAFFRLLDCLFNMDFVASVVDTWKDQIVSAFYVGGDLETQREATIGAWSMHFAVIPWKLFYGVFCPPPLWAWPCFICCLGHIAFLTSFIYDLAELLGCVVDMDDRVTAITIVALGTSLPDLFASKTAAINDEYADASIVNVTGSNAVNVFLGIGLSWSLGAIYWHYKGANGMWLERYGDLGHPEGSFVVVKGTISYSVIVFIIGALICILILIGRRKAFGGELGGPYGAKVLTSIALVGLWIAYVILTVWNASADRTGGDQALAIICAIAVTGGVMLFTGICLNLLRALTVEIHTRVSMQAVTRSSSFCEEEKKKLLTMLAKLFPKYMWTDRPANEHQASFHDEEEAMEESSRLMGTGSFNSNISQRSEFGPMLFELLCMRSELQQWTSRLTSFNTVLTSVATENDTDSVRTPQTPHKDLSQVMPQELPKLDTISPSVVGHQTSQ